MQILGVPIILDFLSITGIVIGVIAIIGVICIARSADCKGPGCRKFCHRGYGE